MYRPPMLGFDDWAPPVRVQWRDGTVVYRGILGGAFDPETLAAERAEQERKEDLRNRDVIVLDDHR